ncbi:MAG: hypothetical protein Q9181_000316 [Wetmoreana brouardii]
MSLLGNQGDHKSQTKTPQINLVFVASPAIDLWCKSGGRAQVLVIIALCVDHLAEIAKDTVQRIEGPDEKRPSLNQSPHQLQRTRPAYTAVPPSPAASDLQEEREEREDTPVFEDDSSISSELLAEWDRLGRALQANYEQRIQESIDRTNAEYAPSGPDIERPDREGPPFWMPRSPTATPIRQLNHTSTRQSLNEDHVPFSRACVSIQKAPPSVVLSQEPPRVPTPFLLHLDEIQNVTKYKTLGVGRTPAGPCKDHSASSCEEPRPRRYACPPASKTLKTPRNYKAQDEGAQKRRNKMRIGHGLQIWAHYVVSTNRELSLKAAMLIANDESSSAYLPSTLQRAVL